MASKTALITGASSGIGYELSYLFARDGYDVILVARQKEKLNTLAQDLENKFKIRARVLQKDLADPNAPVEIFKQVNDWGLAVDVLVNNAGFGYFGKFTDTEMKTEVEMIQVNITALTYLTKLFLSGMVARKSGKILNVASTASFQPGPLMSVYYASKAFVLSFSEAISNELEGTGVTVTALCPGPTATPFIQTAKIEKVKMFDKFMMDPKTVAEIGYKAMTSGKTVAISGFANNLVARSVGFMPRSLVLKMVRRIQEKSVNA